MGRKKDEDGMPFENSIAMGATDLAVRVRLSKEYGHREVWVPKSVIMEDSEVNDVDDDGTLWVQLWWAEKSDLV